MATNEYVSTSIDTATYLRTLGHTLLGTRRDGSMIVFVFDAEAATDAAHFPDAAQLVPPSSLLSHYRSLRSIITSISTNPLIKENHYAPRSGKSSSHQ